MRLTRKQKLERIINWHTHRHFGEAGGEQWGFKIREKWVFIAEADQGLTFIESFAYVYTKRFLISWYDAAARWISTNHPDAEWEDFGSVSGSPEWYEAFATNKPPSEDALERAVEASYAKRNLSIQ